MAAPPPLYPYLGPPEKLSSSSPSRQCIADRQALAAWLARQPAGVHPLPATFIIDEAGSLWLADRRSEHVACAGGRPVRAAGELFFDLRGDVVEASNQSTGYCPDPESWAELAAALERLGVRHPGGFTLVCLFRHCPGCGQRNLVKNDDFTCQVCGKELPR